MCVSVILLELGLVETCDVMCIIVTRKIYLPHNSN